MLHHGLRSVHTLALAIRPTIWAKISVNEAILQQLRSLAPLHVRVADDSGVDYPANPAGLMDDPVNLSSSKRERHRGSE